MRFYRHAAQMLKAFDETIRGFQADTRLTRQLRIGMGPAPSRRMLLGAIPGFQERHPEIQLVLLSIDDRAETGMRASTSSSVRAARASPASSIASRKDWSCDALHNRPPSSAPHPTISSRQELPACLPISRAMRASRD